MVCFYGKTRSSNEDDQEAEVNLTLISIKKAHSLLGHMNEVYT
jgi:hypothetical protein